MKSDSRAPRKARLHLNWLMKPSFWYVSSFSRRKLDCTWIKASTHFFLLFEFSNSLRISLVFVGVRIIFVAVLIDNSETQNRASANLLAHPWRTSFFALWSPGPPESWENDWFCYVKLGYHKKSQGNHHKKVFQEIFQNLKKTLETITAIKSW